MYSAERVHNTLVIILRAHVLKDTVLTTANAHELVNKLLPTNTVYPHPLVVMSQYVLNAPVDIPDGLII